MNNVIKPQIAHVNGVALNTTNESLTADELRQRACSELLRQAAISEGLLPDSDLPSADGVLSEAASIAIEILLEQIMVIPEPSDETCRRHYTAHAAIYRIGERVEVRHILFAVVQGTNVVAIRNRAETALIDVRCHDGGEHIDRFAVAASELSNCPTGAEGGYLGWITAADCAPEFAKELFGRTEVGVLPRLIHSRFGLHIVEVLTREPGLEQPYEVVRGAVTLAMRQQTYVTALRQYLRLLAGQAEIDGVELDAVDTPLIQ